MFCFDDSPGWLKTYFYPDTTDGKKDANTDSEPTIGVVSVFGVKGW